MRVENPGRRLRTVGAKIDEDLLLSIDRKVEELGLGSRSDLVRLALVDFLERISSGDYNPRLTLDHLPSHIRRCPLVRWCLEGREPSVNGHPDERIGGNRCPRSRGLPRASSDGDREGADD
jgi:hypothetical protein